MLNMAKCAQICSNMPKYVQICPNICPYRHRVKSRGNLFNHFNATIRINQHLDLGTKGRLRRLNQPFSRKRWLKQFRRVLYCKRSFKMDRIMYPTPHSTKKTTPTLRFRCILTTVWAGFRFSPLPFRMQKRAANECLKGQLRCSIVKGRLRWTGSCTPPHNRPKNDANDAFSMRFDEGLGWISIFDFSFGTQYVLNSCVNNHILTRTAR